MIDDVANRRELLASLVGGAATAIAGCLSAFDEPSIAAPDGELVDERIDLELAGFEPDERVTVRARASSGGTGEDWEAIAAFETDDAGGVTLAEQSPIRGTYEVADRMGLFWSKRPAHLDIDEPIPDAAWFEPPSRDGYEVTLSASVDGDVVAETSIERRLYDPDIAEVPLDGDLAGTIYEPPGDDRVPGVLVLHGAFGKPLSHTARLLASRGYAAFALQYFGDPDPVPDELVEVPIEYVRRALERLADRDRVDESKLAAFGNSRGGELALLLASRVATIDAVVGRVPSAVVWEGLGPGMSKAGASAWTIDGDPVSYLPRADVDSDSGGALPHHERALEGATDAEIAEAMIPVEQIDAPVLLLSATDDRRWPSAELAEIAADRLEARDHRHEVDHRAYEGAGHVLPEPYLPTAGTDRTERAAFGGTAAANARAGEDAWSRTLSFLSDAFEE